MAVKHNRTVHMGFYVSEAERDFIAEKMAAAGINNRGEYLRRMAMIGYVVRVDYSEIRELSHLLRGAASNLNQISRRVKESGSIYSDDIRDLQGNYEKLQQAADAIKEKLAKL